MSPERLLHYFERISEAPDAIPRLRRFVLDLAVRGKLVAQDPDDEPAEELLARVKAKRDKLPKVRKSRGQATIAFDDEEHPFPIPGAWKWTQMAEIGLINPRNEADDEIEAAFVPMPMISAEYGVEHEHEVRPWGEIKKGYTHFAEGDVGLAKITPCFENGKSTVFRNLTGGIGAGTTELHVVRPMLVEPDYILIFLKSPHFIDTGIPKMTGTAGQKRVPKDYFALSPFPLPPLAEQRRIVAKVDELMALCDELEAAQAKREDRRDRLVAATLHGLNNGDTEPGTDTALDFAQSARFYLNHFPRLTTRPEHVHQLRQTILNLAVRGKLVEQDPDDEPVTKLFERIDNERVKTAREDRRAQEHLQEVFSPELYWRMPPGWGRRCLADVALFIDYRGKTPTKVASGIRLITAKNVRPGYISLEPEEFITPSTYKSWMTRGLPRVGDVLFTTEAPMGNAAVVELEEEFALAQRTICLRIYGGIEPEFFALQILSPPFQSVLDKTATGLTAKGIKAAKLKRLPFVLPPLAEQQRIVAKVDELMALCDELEAHLTTAATTRARLLDATLHEALNGARDTPEAAMAD